MTVRYYLSTDSGAPALNGLAGSAINVLKACLVTGYGSRTGAGWSEAFSGTNLSVLRPGLGNRHYFRIDDTVGGYFAIRGYKAMTAVSTGTSSFPNPTTPSDYYCMKSSSNEATTTPIPWFVVADEKTAYFATAYDTIIGSPNGQMMGFGEFNKSVPSWGDLNSFIWAATTTTITSAATALYANNSSANSGFCKSGNADGSMTTSTLMGRKTIDAGKMEGGHGGLVGGHTSTQTPSPTSGGYNVSRIGCSSNATANGEYYSYMGEMRGVYDPMHYKPLAHLETIAGAGDFAGKTFLAFNLYGSGQMWFEISDTWA